MSIFGLSIILPFFNLLATSLSDPVAVSNGKITFFPVGFNISAYKFGFNNKQFWNGFKSTLFITVVGTFLSLIITTLTAYPLSIKKFKGRKVFLVIFIITMLFNGGLIPNYILITGLGLRDSYLALILPGLISVYNMLLVKNFFETLPESLMESAKIDGPSEYRIFLQLVMPLVKPAWLTLVILLFQRLWTADGGALIFSEEIKPLSYALQQVAQGSIERSGTIAAVSFIMMIVPITFFVISQSRIVETFSYSGMK